jgi:hypothetical protein
MMSVPWLIVFVLEECGVLGHTDLLMEEIIRYL